MANWSRLVRFLRQRSPALQYAAVKEQGAKSGMLHLHVVLTNFEYTPQADISAEWARLSSAWVVNIQRLTGTQAAAYAAKYVSKALDAARKNVTYSSAWPKLPKSGLHLVPIDEVGFWGPTKWHSVTIDGGLVHSLQPGCSCFGLTRPTSYGDHLWLRSLKGRSPPPSRADSGRSSSAALASVR
jgi:hypothetical protein